MMWKSAYNNIYCMVKILPWPVSDTDIWQHQVHTSVQNLVQLSVHSPVHKSSPEFSFYDYPLSYS